MPKNCGYENQRVGVGCNHQVFYFDTAGVRKQGGGASGGDGKNRIIIPGYAYIWQLKSLVFGGVGALPMIKTGC
jgi:hypothetical protein